jgi:predicted PurR-regulated permease PerM
MDNSSDSDLNSTDTSKHKQRRIADIPSIKWVLFLAVLYTLYFAQSLIIPLVLTILIALLLSPLVAICKKVYIPRAVSSLVLLSMLAAPFTLITIELMEPAQKWAKLIPKLSVHVTEQVESISDAFEKQEQEIKRAAKPEKEFSFFGWFSDDDEDEDEVRKSTQESPANVVNARLKQGSMELLLSLLSATPLILAQLLSAIILILFLLIFGPDLFQAFVRELPNKEERLRAIRLVSVTQRQLSHYIATVSVINTGLGLSTAIALYTIGLEDALLWGVLVGVLNFIPYLGSVIGVAIISLAGAVQYGANVSVFLPVAAYLSLNLLESQFITPMVLGKNMQLNPLVVILWLLICGWLWGLTGVLLSVPILVCIKLVLSELGIWKNWLRIIEAGA